MVSFRVGTWAIVGRCAKRPRRTAVEAQFRMIGVYDTGERDALAAKTPPPRRRCRIFPHCLDVRPFAPFAVFNVAGN